MTFLFEQDDVRAEVPRGAAGTIRIVPKIDGDAVDAAGISSLEWTAVEPTGDAIGTGTTAATSVSYGTRTVAVYDVTVPAVSEHREDCVLRFTYTPSGGSARSDVLTFDVVEFPLGDLISVSDILRHRADAGEYLQRIGVRHGETTDRETSIRVGLRAMAVLARQTMVERLRYRADNDGRPRASQILDRRELARIESLYALMHMFGAVASDPAEGDDKPSSLYRHFARQSQGAFESMRVAYTNDEELDVDGTTGYGTYHFTEREQA